MAKKMSKSTVLTLIGWKSLVSWLRHQSKREALIQLASERTSFAIAAELNSTSSPFLRYIQVCKTKTQMGITLIEHVFTIGEKQPWKRSMADAWPAGVVVEETEP